MNTHASPAEEAQDTPPTAGWTAFALCVISLAAAAHAAAVYHFLT